MEYLESYKGAYIGRDVAIIGGGFSSPDDMRLLPDNCVLWGINRHSLILPLSFLMLLDDVSKISNPKEKQAFAHLFFNNPAYKISKRQEYKVYDEDKFIFSGLCPSFGQSGMESIWCAEYMGFSRIFIVGMDMYTGLISHWHFNDPRSHANPDRLNSSLSRWIEFRNKLEKPENIYVFSGPLHKEAIFNPGL